MIHERIDLYAYFHLPRGEKSRGYLNTYVPYNSPEMPEKTRRIFIMSRYEGKSYLTIAQETGLSVKSVEFHISKALTMLRKELKDYLPGLLFLFDYFFYN